MAIVMQLTTLSGGTTYNLVGGTLKYQANSWRVLPTIDGLVQETMTLVGEASDASIMTAVQTVSELAEAADNYFRNDYAKESVMYECHASAETSKWALVHEIELVPASTGPYSPLLDEGAMFFDLTITRSQYFEDKTPTAFVGGYLSTVGGQETLAAIDGSYPARIELMNVNNINAAIGTATTCWVGFRPTNSGVSSFKALWECEDGTAGTDATLATSANASPSAGSNNYYTVSFATPTLARRVYITVDDVTATTDYDHFVGRYLVLCRCMLSAAGTVDLEMRTGFVNTPEASLTKTEKVSITHTAYQFIELGEISIPPFRYKDPWLYANIVRQQAIHLYAERVSGSPNLYLDCLVLIPSEHMFSASNFTIAYEGGVILYSDLEDRKIAFEYNASVHANLVDASIEYHIRDLEFPIEGGEVVIAADTNTPDPDDTIYLNFNYIPRHRMFQD